MKLTKAGMLQYLKEKIPGINILPIYIVDSLEFQADKRKILAEIWKIFQGQELIVRSSSSKEDGSEWSEAGKYKSVMNVRTMEELDRAIEEVYESYQTEENEEILVQPMLKSSIKSGVVFTVDMETMAEYYVINYELGDDTEAVTSGKSKTLKTFVSYKHYPVDTYEKDIKNVISVCREIEKVLGTNCLDIEFAVTKEHKVYIFQVRPIARGNKKNYETVCLEAPLKRIYKKVQKLSRPHPFLLGDTTCFGVMPDWNPAEILGIRPKKLAISLYKELVTDNVWAHQRWDYGYRDLTMHPLMVSFCGIPYIDTRITFNSFIPQNLNQNIAEKLVNYYLYRLKKYPAYHDKIEFEIVFSCFYFGISEKLKSLLQYGFNKNELKRIEFSLLQLTNKIIHPTGGFYKKDLEKADILEQKYDTILHSEISIVDKIYWLIEECKTYGTLPFAGVARAGFIAVQFVRAFVEIGIITQEEMDRFMNSMNTVNKKMARDWKDCQLGKMEKQEFLNKYGHIRPGTYDIMSPRYDEKFNEYFSFGGDIAADENTMEEAIAEVFDKDKLIQIQIQLDENGLEITAEELLAFIREAVEGREYSKYIFTKAVSQILKLVEELGYRVGIKKEELAHLDISIVKQLYVDLYYGDIGAVFRENIAHNKEQYECAKRIKLPSIIVDKEDVYHFYMLQEEPNFITRKRTVSDTIELINGEENVENKIVFIQSADPGYDFLFTKHISGLITQFGGANSHMAIRCAELGIPAIIGAGEQNYNYWKKSRRLEIDCCKQQVISLDFH